MKILIATPLYAPQIGGPATHTRMLEEYLPRHGFSVTVIPFREVAHLPPIVRHLAYAARLMKAARSADLVFAQDTFSAGLPALLASRIARRPLVVRVPGDYAWEQARARHGVADSLEAFQERRYGAKVELLRMLSRLVVRQADVTVVPSMYMERIVRGWRPRTLAVIPNGIDVPAEIVAPPDAPPAPFIVSASRLVPGKGFEMLIDLMPALSEWRLVIVGDGPLRKVLETRAEQVGASDRILFAGSVSPSEMFGWYEAATAFVLNTSFETFSFQVIEALASGTPTVTTAVGAIPEILENGVEGVLVPAHARDELRAAIESVRLEPDRWRAMAAAGKEKSLLFTGEALGARFATLFSDAILERKA